jgi:hypothetical protein
MVGRNRASKPRSGLLDCAEPPRKGAAAGVNPEPWRTIVRGAIAAYKWAFGNSTGTDGLDLHFNWFGFIHWWGPTGASQPCGSPVIA